MEMLDRRQFMIASAMSPVLGALSRSRAEDQSMPLEKDKRLRVISNDPLVVETPDELLVASRITPVTALFVRNHHGAKALCGMQPRLADGALQVSGLVRQASSIPLAALSTLHHVEVEMVLQCSGNFRSEFSKLAPIEGTPWKKGGIGNVKFRGVPIAVFLESSGIHVDASAKFLTVRGADCPENGSQVQYEKSVPLAAALERGLLATELNGQLLPTLHGGPVRFVMPGYYGTSQVKWLTHLRLDASESSNHYQATDYRTPKQPIPPGAKIAYTAANSDANFGMRIACRTLAPVDGAELSAQSLITVRGVAWNDGAEPLTAVVLSTDRGRQWAKTELGGFAGPFAWREWSTSLKLPAGRHELWVRAVDGSGRTQPVDGGIYWNPGGYAWNGVEKTQVTVR